MQERLRALQPGQLWLARTVLAWADAHPDDERVPEALHHVVDQSREGCTRDGSAMVQRAFRLLHGRYPSCPWTEDAVLAPLAAAEKGRNDRGRRGSPSADSGGFHGRLDPRPQHASPDRRGSRAALGDPRRPNHVAIFQQLLGVRAPAYCAFRSRKATRAAGTGLSALSSAVTTSRWAKPSAMTTS